MEKESFTVYFFAPYCSHYSCRFCCIWCYVCYTKVATDPPPPSFSSTGCCLHSFTGLSWHLDAKCCLAAKRCRSRPGAQLEILSPALAPPRPRQPPPRPPPNVPLVTVGSSLTSLYFTFSIPASYVYHFKCCRKKQFAGWSTGLKMIRLNLTATSTRTG